MMENGAQFLFCFHSQQNKSKHFHRVFFLLTIAQFIATSEHGQFLLSHFTLVEHEYNAHYVVATTQFFFPHKSMQYFFRVKIRYLSKLIRFFFPFSIVFNGRMLHLMVFLSSFCAKSAAKIGFE